MVTLTTIKKVLIAAFAVSRLGLGEAAMATPQPQEKEVDDHINLVALISALGVDVQHNPKDPCVTRGWYGGYQYDGSTLALCDKGDKADRMDTIRHEAWHVYQDLKDCNLKDDVVVQPVFTAGIVTPQFLDSAAKNYEKSQVTAEAEAAWAASTFDAEQINILMFTQAKSCGFRL
jgi:hypothetical protein